MRVLTLGLGDTVRVTKDLTNPAILVNPLSSIACCGVPYWEGVAPFFASFWICSTTCSGVVLSHAGGLRE